MALDITQNKQYNNINGMLSRLKDSPGRASVRMSGAQFDAYRLFI